MTTNSMVKIDPLSGTLEFATLGVRLDLLSSAKALPAALQAMVVRKDETAMGWVTYHVAPFEFEANGVALSLSYCGGRLLAVYFQLLEPPPQADSRGVATADFVDEQIILNRAFEKNLGVSLVEGGFTKFPWGEVVCCYHPKDGTIFAGVHSKEIR